MVEYQHVLSSTSRRYSSTSSSSRPRSRQPSSSACPSIVRRVRWSNSASRSNAIRGPSAAASSSSGPSAAHASASPALKARGMPWSTCSASRPRRRWAPSQMSSWTRKALCSSSIATAAAECVLVAAAVGTTGRQTQRRTDSLAGPHRVIGRRCRTARRANRRRPGVRAAPRGCDAGPRQGSPRPAAEPPCRRPRSLSPRALAVRTTSSSISAQAPPSSRIEPPAAGGRLGAGRDYPAVHARLGVLRDLDSDDDDRLTLPAESERCVSSSGYSNPITASASMRSPTADQIRCPKLTSIRAAGAGVRQPELDRAVCPGAHTAPSVGECAAAPGRTHSPM